MLSSRLASGLLCALGVLFACRSQPTPEPAPKSPEHPQASERSVADAGPESFDACLDRELQREGLNRYGDPPDTMYAGGSPLFNEQTETTVSRKDYVARRRPELVRKCE